MKDVAEKADSLENDLNQNTFENKQNQKGSTLETVIKVNENEEKEELPTSVLIDSSNNQYVLAKPGDATAHIQDESLLEDIMLLLITCFIFVLIMYILNLPTFFGYIIAGIVLGQYQIIKNSVQVETISRGLGVIFIMFFLGLEFNIDKIKRVFSQSIFGSAILLIVTVSVISIIGNQFDAELSESLALGACVFLSSTAVILHLLSPMELERDYGQNILGILVAQDVMLGFLLALLPLLTASKSEVVYTLLSLVGNLLLFFVTCAILQYPLLFGLNWMYKGKNEELFALGSVAFCLILVQIGFIFDQSLELSCFVAGMIIGSRKSLADKVVHSIEPLRQLFSTFFFASIGLFIYPKFLYTEGVLLIFLTIGTILFKILSTTLVLCLMFRQPFKSSLIVSIGLGQVSEFTFILASKAKQTQILQRDTYFLLVGVTTISIIVSPILWHLTKFLGKNDFSPIDNEVEESGLNHRDE
jgi:Kef-type K+ transport system membrane component KefB